MNPNTVVIVMAPPSERTGLLMSATVVSGRVAGVETDVFTTAPQRLQ
jgi:hypothetical protein